MLFISLIRFRGKITRAEVDAVNKSFEAQQKKGFRNLGIYWTLGRIDAVRIFEAPDERTVMEMLTRNPPSISTETLVAVSKDEMVKMMD